MSNSPSHLIIGSTGLLGRALRRELHERGVSFATLDRNSERKLALETLSRGIDFDVVYLLAAAIPWGQMDIPNAAVFDANVRLPRAVVNRFPAARIIFASSMSVYGTPLQIPIRLDHPFNSPSFYAQTKLAGETAISCHPQACILRFSSLFGNGMTAETFLPSIVQHAIKRGRIRLLGNGERMQNYLAADRAAKMLWMAGEMGLRGVHHAVAGRSFSNLEVARFVVERVVGAQIEFTIGDQGPSYVFEPSTALESSSIDEVEAFQRDVADLVAAFRAKMEIVT